MPESLEIEVSGIRLHLLAGRAVYWPNCETLFVADPHFGKEATFRRHCVPVPRGSTNGTLSRVSSMLAASGARRLIILGDMFHAQSSLSGDVRQSLEAFFADHRGVRLILVRGNHDARVGPLPRTWPVEIVEPVQRIKSVALSHYPCPVPDDAKLLVCGHLHPAIRIGPPNDRVKLPCFWLSGRRLVLPAIGEFTGTHTIRRRAADRVWVVADNAIVETKSTASPA